MAKKTKKSSRRHHVVLLLDRSGSMMSSVPVTIKGVNEVLATAKNVKKETGQEVLVTLVGFEDHSELIEGYDAVPADKAKPVTSNEVFGRGGTQMYDGINYTFKHLKDKVEDGDTVLFATFTDGGTGGDRTSAGTIKTMITESQELGFTFVLLAPHNYHADVTASKIGIPATNVMEYEYSQGGFRSAFWKLARGLRNYLERQTKVRDSKKVDGFFDGVEPKNSVMSANGLAVTLNMPESVAEKEAGELPPYAPVEAYVVDEYPDCPPNWMNGSSKAASYFVGVKEGHGMWLDFNKLTEDEHDIAVVISVQGVNPITGQKTSALRLEKYENKCPAHDKEFAQDRFCKDCGFKWPSQNYISSNAAPNGQFWLDGFRDGEGKVRQYIFTEEQARGVAAAIIGSDRVFAIGIAFFKSKEKKPQRYGGYGYETLSRGGPRMALASMGTRSYFSPMHSPQNWHAPKGARGLSVGGGGAASCSVPPLSISRCRTS